MQSYGALGRAECFQSTTGRVCPSQSLPLMHIRVVKCLFFQPQGTEENRKGFVKLIKKGCRKGGQKGEGTINLPIPTLMKEKNI